MCLYPQPHFAAPCQYATHKFFRVIATFVRPTKLRQVLHHLCRCRRGATQFVGSTPPRKERHRSLEKGHAASPPLSGKVFAGTTNSGFGLRRNQLSSNSVTEAAPAIASQRCVRRKLLPSSERS